MRKQAGIIFLLRFIRLAFAILNLSFSARYFGVTLERDVWLLALNSIIILDIAIWGPLNDTFRAKFMQIRQEHGESEALNQTSGLLLFINLITLIIVLTVVLFPKPVAELIAPKYDDHQMDSLMFMIRLLAPSFLLNQVTKILTSILNTYDSFIVPEITGLFTQIFTLVIILLLAPSIGISALAVSYYAGLILLFILLITQLNKFGINLLSRFFLVNIKAATPFFLFSVPFFLPHFLSQVNQIIEKSLASSILGAVSVLDYSRKFSDIPLDVLAGIFSSMMVPVLTLKFAQNDKKGFSEEFRKIYQFAFLILSIVIGMLTACPRAIVDFLYHTEKISELYLQEITRLTMFYSWAVFGVFLYYAFGLALLSSKRGTLFAVYGAFAQVFMIAVNLIYFEELSVYTFPLSLGISHLLAACIMGYHFPVKSYRLVNVSLKYTMLLTIVAGLLFFINKYLLNFESAILIIIFNMFALILLLLVFIFVARLEERDFIVNYYRKWISPSSL